MPGGTSMGARKAGSSTPYPPEVHATKEKERERERGIEGVGQ